jgi:hypothetical protein
MTGTENAVKVPLSRILLRRTLLGLVVILLILIPSVILLAITKQPSATYAAMGVLIGAVAVAAGGVRIGLITTVVTGLPAPLAA